MTTKRRGAAFVAVAAASALVLAACGGDDEPDDEPGGEATDGGETGEAGGEAPAEGQIVFGYEQEFASYNNNTSDQNAFRNALVLNNVLSGFANYGPDGLAVPNEELGTYELVSEDPQTVEYTFAEEAVWSDGTPIDCDDILLYWAANSGAYQTGEEDEAGNPVPLFSTAGTTGIEDWVKPDCEPGDKTVTVEYETPYADWEALLLENNIMPAHIVEQEGGLSEDEFIQAIRDDDQEALAGAAEFYNTGWVMEPGQLLDPALMPSSGPYMISDWQAGQSLTLEYNDAYWGTPPATSTVVFRYMAQDQQAQALQNGEIDLMNPQPNPDLVNQLEGIQGVELYTGDQFTYEHLDFNMRGDHFFNDRELREAFAKCVPRQLIVENLIQPMNPEAAVLDARLTYSFQEDYDFQVEGSDAGNYAEVDLEGARQILEDKDMVGQEVRIGYFTPNPRRTNTVELIRDSCNEAGFEIVDAGSDTFFGTELDQGDYDVALFAWIGSAYVSGTASTFMTPPSCQAGSTGNNFGCYSSDTVDSLFNDLLQTLNVDEQRPIVKEIEAELWADLPTIPLFTYPDVAAWQQDIEGIEPNASQAGYTWNDDQWARAM